MTKDYDTTAPDLKTDDLIWSRVTSEPDMVRACRWCGRIPGNTPQNCPDPDRHETFHRASEETARRPFGFYGPPRDFSARKSVAA